MEACWPRPVTSFSTSTSSSPSSSSSSSSLLLDLADELWFSQSVVSFPSFSLPCLPPLFSSLFSHSPDPSTLLAQLMFSTTFSHSGASRLPPRSSTAPWDFPAYHAHREPSHADDEDDEDAYHSYRPASRFRKEEGKDAYLMRSYGKIKDASFATGHGEDGDIHNSAGYGKDENGCPVPQYGKVKGDHPSGNYGVNSENAVVIHVEKQHSVENCDQDIAVGAALADVPSTPTHLDADAEDALSGIHDVGALLRDQGHQGKEDMHHYKWRHDMLDVVLPESWPRHLEPQQDGKESRNAGNDETNVGSNKIEGLRQRGTTGTASHIAKGVLDDGGCDDLIFSYIPNHRQVLPGSTLPSLIISQ